MSSSQTENRFMIKWNGLWLNDYHEPKHMKDEWIKNKFEQKLKLRMRDHLNKADVLKNNWNVGVGSFIHWMW